MWMFCISVFFVWVFAIIIKYEIVIVCYKIGMNISNKMVCFGLALFIYILSTMEGNIVVFIMISYGVGVYSFVKGMLFLVFI